ncbi:Type IIS restriction enzyme Eco57I [Anatilimnocola aggregata]|uniref:site-specific DNA-methyltransferase (adenine-specific) n=1 Tax=Anatilimnocola aggregata TaxID=2528021 RepID=A0A517YC41_9BACT|nr:N-6 DNA methylase [Anatilimnocola aggregata]QDU27781.1 Type IIS restriction enzyme Eco57I [Anatilimnocola aggregata]
MAGPFSAPEHEPTLSRAARRARGVFYTPVEVAEWITRETLGPLIAEWNGTTIPPKVIDPACGGGVFLTAAARLIKERCDELGISTRAWKEVCGQAIYGCDIDPQAVATAHEQLPDLPPENIRCADSLVEAKWGEFAAVIGNPPYVNIRELARAQSPATVQSLRGRYQTARGNFDLYVLFIERALELLQPGGRLGFIVPNKWGTLDYAAPLRELLLQTTTLEQIVDLSSLRVFPQASTYPQVIVLSKRPAPAKHLIRIGQSSDSLTKGLSTRSISQATLSSRAFVLGSDLRLEERVPTVPLEQVCTLHSGASGYAAEKMARLLFEQERSANCGDDGVDFIVSGNIDRYAIERGNVRFLKKLWMKPRLSLNSPQLSAQKQRLYREPKIVFSGMSRRLEAAYDEQGCALGVQVYAAAEMQIEPFYLLGLLNSKLLSYLFRERFAAKRLAGGYLAINKGQLAQLPIRIVDASDPRALNRQRSISSLAQQLHRAPDLALDQQLDELVYELYEVSAPEREAIETSFASPPAVKRGSRAA